MNRTTQQRLDQVERHLDPQGVVVAVCWCDATVNGRHDETCPFYGRPVEGQVIRLTWGDNDD